jgi:hypothetical protein
MWTIDFSGQRESKSRLVDVKRLKFCSRLSNMPEALFIAVVAASNGIFALSTTGRLYTCSTSEIPQMQWQNVDLSSLRFSSPRLYHEQSLSVSIHQRFAQGCDPANVGVVELDGNLFFFGGFERGQQDVQHHSESVSELSLSDRRAWTLLPPMPVSGSYSAFDISEKRKGTLTTG